MGKGITWERECKIFLSVTVNFDFLYVKIKCSIKFKLFPPKNNRQKSEYKTHTLVKLF